MNPSNIFLLERKNSLTHTCTRTKTFPSHRIGFRFSSSNRLLIISTSCRIPADRNTLTSCEADAEAREDIGYQRLCEGRGSTRPQGRGASCSSQSITIINLRSSARRGGVSEVEHNMAKSSENLLYGILERFCCIK